MSILVYAMVLYGTITLSVSHARAMRMTLKCVSYAGNANVALLNNTINPSYCRCFAIFSNATQIHVVIIYCTHFASAHVL